MSDVYINYSRIINDLAFSIILKLNINGGREFVLALGYPNAYSNHAAIKSWVMDHYHFYQDLERLEMLHLMISEINEQLTNHFGCYVVGAE